MTANKHATGYGNEIHRRISLVACFIGGLASGTLYLYSAYAPQLASHLNLLAVHTSLIGMIGNLGMSFSGPIAGSVVDKYGISLPLAIGGLSTFIGYSIVRYCYIAGISSVPVLSIALLLVGSGNSFAFSSLVKCAAVNFPEMRGFATSIPLAAFGLSALFFSSTYKSIPIAQGALDDQEQLLSVLCFVPAVFYIVVFYFARVRSSPVLKTARPGAPELIELNTPGATTVPADTHDIHGTSLIRNRMFWNHFGIMGITAGIGQMYIYSCGYVVRALVLSQAASVPQDSDQTHSIEAINALISHYQGVQVGVISLMSFVGRLVSGSFSDLLYARNRPRSLLLVVACAVLLAGQICGKMISDPSLLWIVSALTGLAYGTTFGSYPTITSDFFGMQHFSQNWGLLALSPVPFSYFFNMLFGRVYDGHSEQGQCMLGRGCYGLLFNMTSVVCIVGFMLVFNVLRK